MDVQLQGHKRYQYYNRQLLVHGFIGQRFCKNSMFDCVYLWFVRLFVGRRGDVLSLIFLIDLVTPFSFACIPWCSVCSRREDMWIILHCFQFSCCWLTYWHVLWLVVFCLANLQISRYCIHIDWKSIFCTTQPSYWDGVPFSQAICCRCPPPCRVFAEFEGHLTLFASPKFLSPKPGAVQLIPKGSVQKKKSWWNLCTDV